jgi:hypothetical protein
VVHVLVEAGLGAVEPFRDLRRRPAGPDLRGHLFEAGDELRDGVQRTLRTRRVGSERGVAAGQPDIVQGIAQRRGVGHAHDVVLVQLRGPRWAAVLCARMPSTPMRTATRVATPTADSTFVATVRSPHHVVRDVDRERGRSPGRSAE